MRRLILIAKRPRLGHVKTRLVPPLTTEQALLLYRSFLMDQLRFLRSLSDCCEVAVYLDGSCPAPEQLELGLTGLPVRPQGRGDLGARLFRAFDGSFRAGAGVTIAMGSDSPTLPARHVLDGFDALEQGADAVVAPAEDGGYVLIGMRQPLPELFRDIPWDGPDVLRETLARARDGQFAVRILAPWYDVDDAGGLSKLVAEIARSGPSRAPATARYIAALLDAADAPVL
jgi:rSAM/selenodomain-associated transferase 1